MNEPGDPRPRGAHAAIDWQILGKPYLLRQLYVVERLSLQEIAKRARCNASTVQRYLQLFEIRRPRDAGAPARAKLRDWLTRDLFYETAARVAWQRHGVCLDVCSHSETCDEVGCAFDASDDDVLE